LYARILVVLVSCAGACSPSCPRAEDPLHTVDTEPENAECAERAAAEVCRWGPDDYARRHEARARRQAELRELQQRHPQTVNVPHDYQLTCGCGFDQVGDCFLLTTRYEHGVYYVISTGAPGCDGTSKFHQLFRERGLDPTRCGGVATIEMGRE
jgi:hypothetical protein